MDCGLSDIHADQVGGVSKFDLVVIDVEVLPALGGTGKDDLVDTGPPQLRREEPPRTGIPQEACQRAFGAGYETARGGELGSGQGAHADAEQVLRAQWVDARFAKAWFDSASKWDPKKDTYAAPVSALRLGRIGMLFHPAELYSYYGLAIRRDSPFEHTLVVGYTDDLIGYLADPTAYKNGEYAATTVPKILDLPPFTTTAARHFTTAAGKLLEKLA